MEHSLEYLQARITAMESKIEELQEEITSLEEISDGKFYLDDPVHLRNIEVMKFIEDFNDNFETIFNKIKEYDL